MVKDKVLEDRRQKVLVYDMWTCKICEERIDANSSVASNEEKTQVLQAHIKQRHKDSSHVDPNMKEEYLVLYFTPYERIIQRNKENPT